MDDADVACAWSDFRRPLLRRSNLQGNLTFIDLVGYGLDGIVWEVNIGNRIAALKVVSSALRSTTTVYYSVLTIRSSGKQRRPKAPGIGRCSGSAKMHLSFR